MFVPFCHHCQKEPHCPKLRKKKKKEKAESQDSKLLFTTAFSVGEFSKSDWFIDSGCTSHVSMQKEWFNDLKMSNDSRIRLTNNQQVVSNQCRNTEVCIGNNDTKVISDVMYIPELAANLLSIIVVCDNKNCNMYMKGNCKTVGKPIICGANVGGIYRLNQGTICADSLAMVRRPSQSTWHRRLGHLNSNGMKLLKDLSLESIMNHRIRAIVLPVL